MDMVDLSKNQRSNGTEMAAPSKRPASSPRKQKSPTKRRNIDFVGPSDSESQEDDGYLDILAAAEENALQSSATSKDTTPTRRSRYFAMDAVVESRNAPSTSELDIVKLPKQESPAESAPVTIKSLSQSLADAELDSATEGTKMAVPEDQVYPFDRIDTNSLEHVMTTPQSLKRPIGPMTHSFKKQLIRDLDNELQALKANMLDIILDPQRGQECAEGRANSARRAQIGEQLARLNTQDKGELEARLATLNSLIVTEYALVGRPIPESIKLEVQQLQQQLKVAEANTLSTSVTLPRQLVPSSPSRINTVAGVADKYYGQSTADTDFGHAEASRTIQTGKVSGKTGLMTPGATTSPVARPEVMDRREHTKTLVTETSRPSKSRVDSEVLHAPVIELSDDEDEYTTHMGNGVDFDEEDFSDDVDYAAEDIEAQQQRYEELSQLAHSQRNVSRKARSSATKTATYAREQVLASPTQHQPMFRPEASQRVLQTQVNQTGKASDLMSLPGMRHPWSPDVAKVLKNTFKLHVFRTNQLEAINATLSGQDVFVLMPTGGGKSLCYQLPSVINSGRTRGLTVVVSPLVSLMQDQVDHLEAIGIRATAYNGEKTQTQKAQIRAQINTGEMDCLYVTPELLALSDHIVEVFQQLRRRQMLARIVIDEAHCVSQWGHDFRPDYKKLGEFRSNFAGVPVIALTATANDKVQVDVKDHLRLQNPACYRQSFNRPNLHYHVFPRTTGAFDKLKSLIQVDHRGQVGIIYCNSKRECEKLAEKLPDAAFYHAGMEKAERANVQRAWQAGQVRIICATIAFGMGIDKANVRFVIHNSLPKSLEGYYQETGRAGRDGKKAMCYLFWAFSDRSLLFRMIDKPPEKGSTISYEQKKNMKEGVQRVVDYADNKADCRRAQVLGFFNEYFDPKDCHGTCDNCQSDQVYSEQDVTPAAKIAIQIVRAVQETGDSERDSRATLNDCVSIARGSKIAKIAQKGWDRIEGFGALKSESRWDISNTTKLFQHLVNVEVLKDMHVTNPRGFVNTYCVPGSKAAVVINNKTKVNMRLQSPRSRKTSGRSAAAGLSGSHNGSDDEDFLDLENIPSEPPQLSSNLDRFRARVEDQPVAARGLPGAKKPRRIATDSHESMLEAMYKRPFTTLDSDRIERCMGDLRALRNKLQRTKGHKRTESTFDDQVLQDIAVHLPTSISAMKAIENIRTPSIDEHGFEILQITNRYKEEEDSLKALLQPLPVAGKNKPSKQPQSLHQAKRACSSRLDYAEPYFNQEAEDDTDWDEGDAVMKEVDRALPRNSQPSKSRPVSKDPVPRRRSTKPSKSKASTSESHRKDKQQQPSFSRHRNTGSGIGAAKPRTF